MMKRFSGILAVPPALILMLLTLAGSAVGQTVAGLHLFEQRCGSCHESPTAPKGAPDGLRLRKMSSDAVYAAITGLRLRKMSSDAVYAAITQGVTHASLPTMTDDEKRLIADYLGSLPVDAAKLTDAKLMPNHCAANPPIKDPSASPLWNGWGVDTDNSRFQPAKGAGLSAEQVPQLKLKWAFGFPATEEMFGQPTIAAGRVFIGVDSGAVYSINAETGCVYWSFQAEGGVRNAINIGLVKGKVPAKYAVYFGDVRANLYSLDAATGRLLWKVKLDEHPLAKVTGTPMLYKDRLYVPLASSEERAGGQTKTYPCCTFRGSVVAVDASTGKQIWKRYIIPDPPKMVGKSLNGVEHWAPAGGAVWDSPTVDAPHHVLYIGTGDSYTVPAADTTDAIMALNMDTGKIVWKIQDTPNDAWLSGCNGKDNSENCPKDLGPDYDFGASPILRTLPGGRRILVAGQKSGMVWAHDPDNKGAVVWKAQLVDKLALGMITFGGASDDQSAYFGLRTGGIAAVQLATGERKWFTPVSTSGTEDRFHGETAALTLIPGVVFSGGWDGILRAFSTKDGHPIWEYDTMREFKTVNGVAAKGGSMGAPGPTVAGGMLFVGSGYVFGGGAPGNVLLAFGPD